jgi:hypothetical protein
MNYNSKASLIFTVVIVMAAYSTIIHGRMGMKGLREKRIVVPKKSKIYEGREAISLARVYLFLAGISLASGMFFLTILLIILCS